MGSCLEEWELLGRVKICWDLCCGKMCWEVNDMWEIVGHIKGVMWAMVPRQNF